MLKHNLYIKTHNITGLKYLGYTIQDPQNYRGSGVYWRSHLKEHGNDITTEIIGTYETKEELKEAGIYYSKLWNVVESNEWANLIPEEGDGASSGEYNPSHRLEVKEKFRQRITGKNNVNFGKTFSEKEKENLRQKMIEKYTNGYIHPMLGKKHTTNAKTKIAKSHTKNYKFINPLGDLTEIHDLNKFCKENNLNQGHMVQVAKRKLNQHKGWTIKKENINEAA